MNAFSFLLSEYLARLLARDLRLAWGGGGLNDWYAFCCTAAYSRSGAHSKFFISSESVYVRMRGAR